MIERASEATHGGNLRAVAARYGVDAEALLDFSANINPLGPPTAVVAALATVASDPRRLTSYPDPRASALREVIAKRHGIESDCIAVAGGATAVLQAAIGAANAERCVIPVPAFSEYARIASSLGLPVDRVPMHRDFMLDEKPLTEALSPGSVVIISNPHNPSGALLDRSKTGELIDLCEERQAAIVIDEAFIDYVPEATSLPRALKYERAIVVRSLTKFYAIPGIRIGYAISRIAPALRKALPTWPVGVFETEAAIAALNATDYERESIAANEVARKTLADGLMAIGIVVFSSNANYLLLELPIPLTEMDELLRRLVCEHGIVVRDCRNYDGMSTRSVIRVAVRSGAENQRLLSALCS